MQEAWHLTGVFLFDFLLTGLILSGRSVTLNDDVLHLVGCLNFELIQGLIFRLMNKLRGDFEVVDGFRPVSVL